MEPTPRPSRSSSASSRAELSIDLSSLPAPSSPPSPPSNTLLFTNLDAPAFFAAASLQAFRAQVSETAAIHSFAPLRSFRRVVVSFADADAAAAVRRAWDGRPVCGARVRVYFGQPTPVRARDELLSPPVAADVVFLSPPPSPPLACDDEDDAGPDAVSGQALADALSRLGRQLDGLDFAPGSCPAGRPRRSSSVVIYSPVDSGFSPDLPAVLLEDLTAEPVASRCFATC